MSTDFDFDLTPGTPSGPAPAEGGPLLTPSRPQTRTEPVPAPAGTPTGELAAFLVTGGPAVALIAGCYLLWAYGPWLLLGALLLAAVAAVAAIRAVAARARRSRSKGRASAPTRAGPGIRGWLGGSSSGSRGVSPAASGAKGTGAGRAGGRAGGHSGGMAAVERSARRKSMLSRATSGAAGAAAGPRAGQIRKSPSGKALDRAAKTLAPGMKTKPAPRAQTAGGKNRSHAKPGLLARTLGKTMPAGRTTTAGGTSTRTPKTGTRKPAPAARTPKGTRKTTKPSRLKRTRRTTAAGKTTPTGRNKVRVTPTAASRIARKAAVIRANAAKKQRQTKATGPVRSKAAARITRRVRRIATHRKIRSTRARVMRGTRRAIRTGNTVLSPIVARTFLRTGKTLGWAQRRMTRIANSTSGPAWAPRLARAVATGIGGVLTAGLWVSRRRTVQKWMLKHYATTGLSNPATVAAAAVRTVLGPPRPATSPAGHTAKPGPAIRITAATQPIITTSGATVPASLDEIADAFAQHLAQFHPESVQEFTDHFEEFAPLMESFCSSMASHAQRLQDEYGVKGNLVDMVEQFGSAFGGMHDMATEVVQSWRSEHAEDIERHENPRPNEAETWNYNPGA